MARVIRLERPGSDARLDIVEHPVGEPGPGEIRLRQTAVGLNFIDVYQRQGLYPIAVRPAVPGVEAAGVVAATGPGVSHLVPGQRVAYAGTPGGAYATERLLPAWRAVPLPDEFEDGTAATLLARGITVHMLATRVYTLRPRDTVLIHGAAGGLGNLLARLAKAQGAAVIGTVSTEAKAAVARAAGVDEVVIGRDADFVAAALRFTSQEGVHAAFDGAGGTVLQKTLACVRPFGTVVSYGQAAGPIPPLAVEEIGPRRSLLFARPSVMQYMNDPETYRRAAAEAIALARAGIVSPPGPAHRFEDFQAALDDLEGGLTTGSPHLVVQR